MLMKNTLRVHRLSSPNHADQVAGGSSGGGGGGGGGGEGAEEADGRRIGLRDGYVVLPVDVSPPRRSAVESSSPTSASPSARAEPPSNMSTVVDVGDTRYAAARVWIDTQHVITVTYSILSRMCSRTLMGSTVTLELCTNQQYHQAKKAAFRVHEYTF